MASAATEETESLKKQLKETQDRLHAFEADNDALRRLNDSSKKYDPHPDREFGGSQRGVRSGSAVNYLDLKMRMEALGLASVGDNKEALEQRLLKSVSDLKLLRDEKDKIAERMVALSETVLLYMKTASQRGPADPPGNRGATPGRERGGGRHFGEGQRSDGRHRQAY